jgi:cobalt-zinc-cadmium efflux system membrane fusion protein
MKTIKYIHPWVLFFILISCNSKEASVSDKAKNQEAAVVELTPEQIKNGGIESAFAVKRNISNTIQATGILEVPPQNRVSVSTPVGGFLRSTSLLEGIHVHKGDVLAEIEHQDILKIQEDYLELKERSKLLSQDLERQRLLRKDQVNAVKTLQQAESEFNAIQIRLIGLSEMVKMIGMNPNNLQIGDIRSTMKIRASQDGYVTSIHANSGKFVTPNEVLFELINTEHLHAELQVNEKYVGALKEGQKIKFKLANQPGKSYNAEVYLIGKTLGENRSVRVHGHIDKDDVTLIPGLFIEANIETNRDSVLSIQESAVVSFGGGPVVFLEESAGKYRAIPVKKFANEDGFVAIESINGEALEGKKLAVNGTLALLGILMNTGEEE